MNMENKFEMACCIMEAMVAKYSKSENLYRNATLDIMFKIREKVNQRDAEMIDRVIEFYGPVVKKDAQKKGKKLRRVNPVLQKLKNFLRGKKDDSVECQDFNRCKNCQANRKCFLELNR